MLCETLVGHSPTLNKQYKSHHCLFFSKYTSLGFYDGAITVGFNFTAVTAATLVPFRSNSICVFYLKIITTPYNSTNFTSLNSIFFSEYISSLICSQSAFVKSGQRYSFAIFHAIDFFLHLMVSTEIILCSSPTPME